MKYTVELEPNDTEAFRSLVTQAFDAGKNWQEGSEEVKLRINAVYGRLLEVAKQDAQNLARRAFQAGHQAPRLEDRGSHV